MKNLSKAFKCVFYLLTNLVAQVSNGVLFASKILSNQMATPHYEFGIFFWELERHLITKDKVQRVLVRPTTMQVGTNRNLCPYPDRKLARTT